MMKKLLLSSVILLTSLTLFSQTRPTLEYYMPAGVTFDTSIPVPGSSGHEVGEWHVTHDRLVGYMKLLDVLSDRAVWEDYGRSWEGDCWGT